MLDQGNVLDQLISFKRDSEVRIRMTGDVSNINITYFVSDGMI